MKLVNLISNILKEDQETYGSPVLRKLDWTYETLVEWAAEECQEQVAEADYRDPSDWGRWDNTTTVGAEYEDEGIYLELEAKVDFDRHVEQPTYDYPGYTEEVVTRIYSATVTAYPEGNYDKSLASWDLTDDLQAYFDKQREKNRKYGRRN